MSYQDREILKNRLGEPVPQYDDPEADLWRPWQGDANGPIVQAPLLLAQLINILTRLGQELSVSVTNLPATQQVAGAVTATQGAPGDQPWLVADTASLQKLTDILTQLQDVLSVSVGNFPADQLVHGTIAQGAPGADPWPIADAAAVAKLELIRLLLAGTLATSDGTSQGHLANILAELQGTLTVADTDSVAKMEQVRALLAGTLAVADAATLAKVEAVRAILAGTLTVADANTLAKVEQVRALLAGTLTTQLSGRNLTQAPVHGAKTVTNVAASLFAGAARLANRNYISIYNESNNTVYIGGSGVTTANGFPILPGETKTYSIDPTADFGIYAIAASNSAVRVEEGK